jgi:uncharacterized OsmC-like protein
VAAAAGCSYSKVQHVLRKYFESIDNPSIAIESTSKRRSKAKIKEKKSYGSLTHEHMVYLAD